MASPQASPYSANQLNNRCNPTARTVISTSARAVERHKMERIGGDRICESALTAASSMTVLSFVTKVFDLRFHLFDGSLLDRSVAPNFHRQRRDLGPRNDSSRM